MTPRKQPLATVLVTVLAAWLGGAAAPAVAGGGQDWPFFCSVSGTTESFRVMPNRESPTGYTMYAYDRGRFVNSLPATIGYTSNRKYWTVSATKVLGLFREWQFFAMIGREEIDDSAGSHTTLRGQQPAFDMVPVSCRRQDEAP